ncbi:hypothetical protein MLD38_039363 [Melastoma candidum]|uniref:Uncharacterized protein n=1 Tax=Melastoma candidum TaxID=119954 RepID=A0ACB9L2J7_9MYRT|nr:hypothetical protein MLD38_039363 [Melastoma candidum]
MASFSVHCSTTSPALVAAMRVKPNRVLFLSGHLRGNQSSPAGPVFKVSASANSSVAANVVPESVPSKDKKKEIRIPDAASISAFMDQVADLIELVDTRDIIELQLKQTECEVTIRKKEALRPPSAAPPAFMMHQPPPLPPVAAAPSPPSKAVSAPSMIAAAPPPKPSVLSHPPLKCPMAGTFYRSPSPGAPPFVKVGDKVQKGQVVCIIEAMKLMNEIECDQAGTVVEILVDDGKPVSVDTPLFVIAP